MSLPIYIIGHRRPDTDAICSALALAELKQKLGVNAVAARIGHLNPETQFIIDKLGVKKPLYMTTAKSTLSEIDIDPPVLIYQDDSLLMAWDLCHDNGVKTLYVVNSAGEFVGMTTLAQISMIQMQDLNLTSELLKQTPAQNIADTLEGRILLKGTREFSGYVRIDDKRVNERDLSGAIMVLSDHEDAMIKCMAKGCAAICIAENFIPDDYIMDMAERLGVTLISTHFNTMKIIQMIYRSIPIRLIMTPADKVIRFNISEYIEDVEKEMLKTRHSNYPVVYQDNLMGSVARYHLLKSEKKRFILVDHNEKKQSIADIEQAEIVEIVDHHRIGDIETPVPIVFRNMTVGSSCTIVSLMYREYGVEMSETAAKLIAYGMISDTMNFHSPTCTEVDRMMAKSLEEKFGFSCQEMATELFENTATIRGKSFDKILYRDNKEYILNGKHIAVAQVFIFDLSVVDEIKEEFEKYLTEENKAHDFDLYLMTFTNVEGKGSRFIYVGKLAPMLESVIKEFEDKGFVSRKKQIVPGLASELI